MPFLPSEEPAKMPEAHGRELRLLNAQARERDGKGELRTVEYVDNVASFWCNIGGLDDAHSKLDAHSKHGGYGAASSTGSSSNNHTERPSTHPSTASSSTVPEESTSEKSLTDCWTVTYAPPGLQRPLEDGVAFPRDMWQDMWQPSENAARQFSPQPHDNYFGNEATARIPQEALDFLDSFNVANLSVNDEVKGNQFGKTGKPLIDMVFTELGASIPKELLEAIDARGLLEKIPRNEHQQLTSIGSIGHTMNIQCRPCLFWFRGRCSKGILCEFCHYVHEGQRPKRIRAAKNTRLKMRDGEMPKAFAL